MIGPAISCGKKEMKRAYSEKLSTGSTSPRYVSTVRAMIWKVKNEIPNGSRISGTAGTGRPAQSRIGIEDDTKKAAYLKNPSTTRLNVTDAKSQDLGRALRIMNRWTE
jgi:hypothetical protein